MSNVLALLNGKKSYLGFLMVWIAFAFGPVPVDPDLVDLHVVDVLPSAVRSILMAAGAPLGVAGFIHKMAKISPQ